MIQDLMENVKLTPQEQNIVSYIEQHPKEVMKLNAKELSEKIFVSPPTMNRFIKKLGFNGYFDFQRTFIQEQSMVEETKYRRITKYSYINDIIDTLPLIYQHVFKETQKLTKTDAFIRTINYMLQSKQIDFYANDNNYSEIQTIALKLNSIGIRAQVFNTINSVYLDHINPQETIAFVVSHSGSNKTMIDAAYALRKKRIRVVGVTGRLSQDLELICNENLYIDSYNHHLPHSIMLYGLSIHYIFDVLYTALYFKKIK